MKYNLYNWLKIRHYESSIQDIEAQTPKNNPRKKMIMEFIKNEYKRRIKFHQGLDKLEKK